MIIKSKHRYNSFTLLELLIVIGIIGALSAAVIVIINPVELYRQTRDTRRISDLQTIDKAVSLADFESIFLGASSTVYVSIPDSSPTCANLGLPSLPFGWSYSCKTSANYRKVDSFGWIPVNFTLLSQGSPLSILPIDPLNTNSSGQYYTYVPGGSWELTAYLESDKYKGVGNLTGKDGGTSFNSYEIGNDLKLTPSQVEEGANRDPSLVGYWTFDEGTGATSTDASGKGNNGSLVNGPAWTTGKINNALSFNGTNNYVNSGDFTSLTGAITVSTWIYATQPPASEGRTVVSIFRNGGGGCSMRGWNFGQE